MTSFKLDRREDKKKLENTSSIENFRCFSVYLIKYKYISTDKYDTPVVFTRTGRLNEL